MSQEQKLEPCPFCGSANVGHYEVEGRDNHSIECFECFSSGNCYKTKQGATEAWNRRAALSATQPAQAAQGEPVVPPELDVRKIMLDIVPGDGNGFEVYAKNVDDVVAKLTEMGERIESLEGAQPAPVQPAATDAWPKLDKPATVGAGTFGVGVSARLVVEAAQRRYRLHQEQSRLTPEQAREQEINRRKAWDLLNGPAQPGQADLDGWRLVPVDPPLEMMEAMPSLPAVGAPGDMDLKNKGWSLKAIQNRHRWMGALSAAPTPPAQQAAQSDAASEAFQAMAAGVPVDNGLAKAPAAQSEPVKPLFASKIAARKWVELQDDGARMQSIAFDGHKCGQPGTINPWGVVRWVDPASQGAGEVVADLRRLASVCPELNLNNYGPDDVDELNAWAIEVSQAIDQLTDTQPASGADVLDAERYRMVRRGQHWSVINGIGDTLRGDALDAAIDAAIAASGRQE